MENPPYFQESDFRDAEGASLSAPVRPTPAQEARRRRLRRFNRLVVTIPVGVIALTWFLLVLGLIWLSVAGDWFAMDTNQTYYRQLFSAVADVVTMLLMAPMLLLCALPMVGAIAFVAYRRQSKAGSGVREPALPLFWRIENKVVAIHDGVARTMPKLARPVINAHATAAFVRRFVIELKQVIMQEIVRNGDDR